jgi:predicted ATPase
MVPFVVISGCSGGGKSKLIAELGRRGHHVVEEPGRRIVREELASGGRALPWIDPRAFIDRAIAMATAHYLTAETNRGWTFFDRGLVDAFSGLAVLDGTGLPRERLADFPYYRRVFLTPPWPELFATEAERQHGFDQAVEEYERLRRDFSALGYEVVLIPKLPVAERADFVLTTLGPAPLH